jgi:hypothetical protein
VHPLPAAACRAALVQPHSTHVSLQGWPLLGVVQPEAQPLQPALAMQRLPCSPLAELCPTPVHLAAAAAQQSQQ